MTNMRIEYQTIYVNSSACDFQVIRFSETSLESKIFKSYCSGFEDIGYDRKGRPEGVLLREETSSVSFADEQNENRNYHNIMTAENNIGAFTAASLLLLKYIMVNIGLATVRNC
uniref:Uncharacterized protein n=1 Tax=Glossina pallidipes TaxID=7398 RepID=A0A1A9ZCH2_GLOPL